jgi:cellulose synthase operon protein C
MVHFIKTRFTKTRLALLAFAILGPLSLVAFQLLNHGSVGERARGHYERGVKLAEARDYAKAGIELRNALDLKNNMLPAWRKLAQIQEATQQWNGLTESLRSIVSLAPSDVEARIGLAKLLALSGRVYQALELTSPDSEGGQSAKILGLRAAILYKLNDKSEAIRQAEAALAIDAGNADALVVLANERMGSGDVKGALQILDSAAALNGTDVGIQLTKLKIYEQLGDHQKVESLLRTLIERHPKETSFRKQLIKFYIGQHREDEAEMESRAIVDANPTDPESELALVRLLYAAKGSAAAKQELVARINAGGEVFPFEIALAKFDYSLGNFTDAEQRIQSLISHARSTEQTIAAQQQLAEIYLRSNKIDAAETLVSEVLRKNSRGTDGLKLRASIRLVRGQLEPAITDLQQALSDQPQSAELMLLLALAYEQSGSIARAEKLYSDAVRSSDFDPRVGLNYAQFLLRRGGVDRAEQFLSELNKRSPKNLAIMVALAKVELTREDWGSAETLADSIRSAGGTDGLAEQMRGAALIGQRKYDESISAFENAVEASPSAVQPMASLVAALIRAQKTDKAVALINSAIGANPDNAELQVLMGSVQLASGARDQALESFKSAIAKNPKSVAAYLALAKFYSDEKKLDEALAVIRSGLQVEPGSVDLHLQLAGALEQNRQYEAAIAEYEIILNKQPNSMVVANNLASLLSDHRNDKASLERAQSLAARLKESPVPQFKDTLGWVSYRGGDYVRAVSLLEKAASALPNIALVQYHLALSYIAIRETGKASEYLKAALLLAPDGELGEKSRAALAKLGDERF